MGNRMQEGKKEMKRMKRDSGEGEEVKMTNNSMQDRILSIPHIIGLNILKEK